MIISWRRLLPLVLGVRALAAQEPSATLAGVVSDSESGHPLEGAVILVGGTLLRAVTDASGSYRLNGIPPGRYHVWAALLGYQDRATSSLALGAGDTTWLDFALPRGIIDIPPVVVTASRGEERPGDSPASIAVLTQDAFVRRGAITIDQALPFVPGVIFNGGQVDIRGAEGVAGGVGSRVLMLLDGHPILTGDGGEVDFNAVPTLDLDRVEIVKGAYSAVYGSNALGGVVNVITTPIGPTPEAVVAAHYGFYDTPAAVRFTNEDLRIEDLDLQYSRRLSELGARVAVRREHSDGFEQDAGLDRWMVRTKLSWPADDPHASSAYAMFTSEDDGNHMFWLSDSEPYAVAPPTAGDWSRAQKLILGAALNAVTTPTALLQVNPYVFYNTLQNHFNGNRDYHRATRYGGNVQLAFNPWRTHTATVGLDISRTGVVSNFLGHPVLWDGAFYAQDEVGVSERLRGSVGTRLDFHDTADPVGGRTEYTLSPKIGVVFKPVSTLSLRASIGHGYRAPSAIEQFVSSNMGGILVVPNPGLRGETAWSSEVGVTMTRGPWLQLDAALFQSDYHDLIGPGVAPGTVFVFQFQNVQRARVRGLDASAKLGLIGGLLGLEGSYTFLDARDLDDTLPLPYRSRHNITFTLSGPGNMLGLDVRYRSRIERVLAFPADPLPGAFTIVDLRFGYRLFGTGLQLKVSNLLQAAYVDVLERNRGAPRSILLTAIR